MELVLSDGRPEIRVVGSLGGASRIVIASSREDAPLPLTVAAAKRLKFATHVVQVQLAQHLFAPPVKMRGLRRRKTLWVRELDCGSFWAILDANAQRLAELRGALRAASRRRGHQALRTRTATFADVRQARREAYLEPKLGHDQRAWQSWLVRISPNLPVRGIPAWCIDLAQQLRATNDA
ncbi:MAG: hypothetical protein A3G24_09265 [Betaproteobacteria bacterium RIFCSPLOWO2_12_FULL_62_13]|nr:MAG: hypothetical protein A3G24_09265 [Betaproteobacteria bacterium RIFCSPLOWO2_12_FULL_62_13]